MKTAVINLPPMRPTMAPYACGILNKIIKHYEPQCELIDLNLNFWDFIWTEYLDIWDQFAGKVMHRLSKEELYEAISLLKQNNSTEQAVEKALTILQSKSSIYEEPYNVTIRFGQIKFPDEVYNDLHTFCSQESGNIFWEYLERMVEQKDLKNYDLIFISVMVKEQLVCAYTLSQLMKQKYDKRPRIAIGGAYITRFSDKLKNENTCQVFDEWLPGLAEDLIPGILGKKTKYELNYEYETDLGTLHLDKYYSMGKIYPLMASRFCYYHRCAFCDNAYNYQGKKVNIQAPETIFNIMKNAYSSYGVNRFYFLDDCLSDSFMNQLSELIISGNSKFIWAANARFSRFLSDVTIVDKLAKGGCKELFLGLESYSQPELNRMKKGIRVEWVRPTLINLKKKGILVYISIMVGFPGQTAEDFAATYGFLRENEQYIDMVDVNIFYKTPFLTGDPCEPEDTSEEEKKAKEKVIKSYYDQLMAWVIDNKKSPSLYRRYAW